MQDRLASRYYIVICIDSQCDQNGWIDSTLVPEFCKNFLEENSFSYLNLESLFSRSAYHYVIKAQGTICSW